ncbi:MAG: branched-chain amino acid ABC transporter permease [Acidilobaceae archaeon]
MKALVRERKDVLIDVLTLAFIAFLPLALVIAQRKLGLMLIPMTEADIVSIFALAIIVLALNLVAGYTGIPHFGMHFFVYIGAFGMSAMAMRLYIATIGFLDESLREKLLGDEIIKKYATSLMEVLTLATGRSISLRVSDIVGNHAGSSPYLTLFYIALGLISSVFLALAFSFLLGLVALRLRGDYLAIFSLIMAEFMVMVIFHNLETLGGGVYGVSAPRVLPQLAENLRPLGEVLGISSPLALLTALILFIALVATYAYSIRTSNSPLGRLLRGIRDDELVVSIFGRDVGVIKMKVILLGCVIASLAGALYTLYMASVIPRSFNRMDWTFLPWTMMILGGMANSRGVIVGALLVYLIRRLSSSLAPSVFEIFSSLSGFTLEQHTIDQVQAIAPHIVTGALVLLVLYLRPQGLLPEEPSKTLRPKVLSTSFRSSSQESS